MHRVGDVPSALGAPLTECDRDQSLRENLAEILEITKDVFPGQVFVEDIQDPEYPETMYLVFHIVRDCPEDDVNKTIDREIEWHRRVREVYPDATCRFRLAVE